MDKAADLKLIADNWDVLLPAAERGFEENARGMVLVDTTQIVNEGYPIRYVSLANIPDDGSECGRMVRTYDPQKEVILSLFRSDGRVYSYTLGRPNLTPLNRQAIDR
jgi:hypothetical protein